MVHLLTYTLIPSPSCAVTAEVGSCLIVPLLLFCPNVADSMALATKSFARVLWSFYPDYKGAEELAGS